MARIRSGAPPRHALHARYADEGGHVDCFTIDMPGDVPLAGFVEAFYTTWLFTLERLILRWCVDKPSTDEEAAQLARGERDTFAAWTVEARAPAQLLMCDYLGKTRSWLMAEPGGDAGASRFTRLYFGSAIVAEREAASRARRLTFGFRALLPFHRLYSRALLRAAHARLASRRL